MTRLSPLDRELAALDLKVRWRGRGVDPTDFREAVDEARVRALRASSARSDLPGELQSELES